MLIQKNKDHVLEDFKRGLENERDNNITALESERIFATIWKDVIHQPTLNEEILTQYEDLIKQGVESLWGTCEFQFNREQREIIITARDGRSIELVSGKSLI